MWKSLISGFLPLLFLAVDASGNQPSDEARAFFEEHIIVDGTCFPYYRPGTALHTFPRNEDGIFDMAEYPRATGVDLAVWDIRHLRTLLKLSRGVEAGQFINTRIIKTVDDIQIMRRQGEHGWLFYTQHPWALQGSVEPVQSWYDHGLRMVQVVYGSRISVPEEDKLGTGSSAGDDELSGLTELGKKFIEECNRLGIVVDLSHCNRQTTLDACEITAFPVTCTHAGSETITPARRNKSEEEIRAIAATGGVIGIAPIKFMISANKKGASMDDFIAHIEHVISVAGIEHVGISSDINRNGISENEVAAYTSEDLNGEQRWFHLYDELRSRGYESEDLKLIFGLNFLRVFEIILK